MDGSQLAVAATIGIIVGVTVLSGPLVGAFDLTDGSPPLTPGIGSASAAIESLPADGVTLTAGRYDSGSFYLTVPDAVISVSSVEGSPIVAYRIAIPELGYVRETVHFLQPGSTGTVRLELERATFPPDRITENEYTAVLSVEYRSGEDVDRLAERRVVVGVDRG